jgi:hypothetical protein
MLLLDALEQLQWSMHRKFLARPYQKQAARRTVAVGCFAFSMFILPYVFLYAEIHITHNTYTGPGFLVIQRCFLACLALFLAGSFFFKLE